MEAFVIAKKYVYFLTGILIFLGLYLTSLHSYLLFHSLVEIFSIVVACGIFMVVWNSRRFLDNNYLLFIGIAYLFVGGLDLVHTLAYTGMGVFQGYETNLPTQLWISARYLESISFLIAPLFFKRKLKVNLIFIGYTLGTSILLLSIFYWNIFPACFIEGMGLTPFKKICEYIISLILLTSIVLLLKKRNEFDSVVLQWVVWSIILTIISELAFTFYIHAYGFSNLVGHYLKVVSFYLIYKAIIETGLRRPYDLLFRDLKQREEALARLASFPELNPNPVVEIDLTGNVYYLNPAAKQLFPNLQTAGPKHPWLADFESLVSKFKQEPKASHVREMKIGNRWHQQSIYHAPEGNRIRIYGLDITNRKRMEEELRKSRDELEIRVKERTVELISVVEALQDEMSERKQDEETLKEQSRILEAFFTSTITPLVFLDRDFNFVRVNEAYAKACQRNISEFVGHNHFEFYPSDAKEIFEQVVETKIPYQAVAQPFTFPDHPEWGITYWDWTLTPLLDEKGKVEFLVFSLEDVTERKWAEQAVKAEQQRFKDVLDQLPAYLVLLSPDYHVPFANRFFRERFGESHGRRCFDYLFGRSEPCEICETYAVLKTNAPHHWEWTGPDGRNYDIYNFPFTDTDGSTLVLEMGIDITEHKRAEEALRESENRLRHLSSQLLAVQENERKRVAREIHDGIGQMLTAIKFKVEDTIQQKGKGNAKIREKSLETIIPLIQGSVEEVRRIQMDLRPSTLDDLGILATIDWFCREFEKIYSAIHIEKLINIHENEVPALLKTVIFRVMQEALNNIAKHSKADLVHLSLKKKDDRIELVVEDNGTGFDLEKSKKGFGLGSMKERIELSGGSFVMESTRGSGTVIRATWPI